ncbi:MAG: hypothetical protein ABSE89_10840 [Sedimentisphaerales bacterium]
MESDNFDNQVERGIVECNEAVSNLSDAASAKVDSASLNKTSAVRHPQADLHNMPSIKDILKNKAANAHPAVQNIGKEFVRKMVEKISNSQQQDRSAEIPSLDLGQQILAQQRKVAALKRKSPLSQNDSSKAVRLIRQSVSHISFMSQAPASPQQRIIADIVTKEILILSSAR